MFFFHFLFLLSDFFFWSVCWKLFPERKHEVFCRKWTFRVWFVYFDTTVCIIGISIFTASLLKGPPTCDWMSSHSMTFDLHAMVYDHSRLYVNAYYFMWLHVIAYYCMCSMWLHVNVSVCMWLHIIVCACRWLHVIVCECMWLHIILCDCILLCVHACDCMLIWSRILLFVFLYEHAAFCIVIACDWIYISEYDCY